MSPSHVVGQSWRRGRPLVRISLYLSVLITCILSFCKSLLPFYLALQYYILVPVSITVYFIMCALSWRQSPAVKVLRPVVSPA